MRNIVGLAAVMMVGVALVSALGEALDPAEMFSSVSRQLGVPPSSR